MLTVKRDATALCPGQSRPIRITLSLIYGCTSAVTASTCSYSKPLWKTKLSRRYLSSVLVGLIFNLLCNHQYLIRYNLEHFLVKCDDNWQFIFNPSCFQHVRDLIYYLKLHKGDT